MLQIPRMESPLHLLTNSTFIFFNDSKALRIIWVIQSQSFSRFPARLTAITGPQNWREHQRRRRCRSTSKIVSEIVGMKHTTRVKADERHPRQDEKRARALLKKASSTDLTTIGDRVKVGLPATFGGVSWLSLALFNVEQAVF